MAPDEPMAPAPGQGLAVGSLAYLKGIAKADPLFAVLLALLALGALLSIAANMGCWIIVAVAAFWGVLTLRYWGYLLATIGAGLGCFWSGLALVLAIKEQVAVVGLALIASVCAIYVFSLVVLLTRRRYFA